MRDQGINLVPTEPLDFGKVSLVQHIIFEEGEETLQFLTCILVGAKHFVQFFVEIILPLSVEHDIVQQKCIYVELPIFVEQRQSGC